MQMANEKFRERSDAFFICVHFSPVAHLGVSVDIAMATTAAYATPLSHLHTLSLYVRANSEQGSRRASR